MKNICRRWDPIVCGLFLGAQCLLPFVSIAFFRHCFANDPSVIFYHLLIVEFSYGFLLGAASMFGAVRWLRGRRATRYLLPFLWASLTIALYYIYLLAWGGRLGNGMNMRFSWVAPYVWHPALAVSVFSISPFTFWSVLVGGPLAILAVYAAAARPFAAMALRGLTRLRRWWRVTPHPGRSAGGLLAVAALAVCAMLRAICDRGTADLPKDYLFGDPIFISLFQENSILPLAGVGNASDALGRAYAAPRGFQKKNVIVIVVDACRADHLGALGYRRDTTPFLDALQRSGHLRVVRSFYSASCCTFGGIMTMLRSRHWFKMTLHGFALQDVLKRVGYRVHFLLSGDHTNFANLKSFYGPSMDTFSDGLNKGRHFGLNDDRGMFESFSQLAPYDGTPSFLLLHLMSVHYLGLRLPASETYTPDVGEWSPVIYSNNYDNGVVQADHNIYEIFVELKRKGYLQNSVVVITGDHGESLGERGIFGHSHNLYAEEVQPPLLIYDPEPVVYRNLDFARQIDLAPTILDRLGLPIPPGWDGRSLLRAEVPRFAYLRFADTYAVVDHTAARTLKYIYDARARKEEVYDDTRDPEERCNILAAVGSRELQELRQALLVFSLHPGA